jgi:uncharacterized protein YbaP (TraB family)
MRKLMAFVCVLAASSAAAQPAPPPLPLDPVVPQWAEIETVHSTARPGPALWHVTKGDSEVWILGMIDTLPKGVTWNQEPLAELMTGSHALIVGELSDIDLLDVSWFVVTHCCSFFRLDHGTLGDFLPEATRVKLASMRESVGGDAWLYQGDAPMGAARRLNSDFIKKYADDLRGTSPMPVVFKLASDKKVPQQPISHIDILSILSEALKLTPQQQLPCLEAKMADIERLVPNARPMAEAWAVGDVKGIKAHFAEPRMADCMATAVHAFGSILQNRVPSFVSAIDAALDKPGKTIAVMDLGPLLRKGGVLEQLETQHLTIEGPAE